MILFLVFAEFSFSIVKFGTVIDAGGSNTQVYVFKWNDADPIPAPSLITTTDPTQNKSVSLVLDRCLYDQTIIPSIFPELLSYARAAILENGGTVGGLNSTELYVRGTSSMRDLSEREQETVINKTLDYLYNNSDFNVTDDSVAVLDANEEAIFAWVSVNLALQKTQGQTVPVIGISRGNNYYVIEHGDTKYSKYIHSINFVGSNVKLVVYVDTKKSIGRAIVNHTLQEARVIGRADINSSCYVDGSTNEDEDDIIILVNGIGGYNLCNESLAKRTLSHEANYPYPLYFFDRVSLPIPTDKVYAVGSYYSTYEYIWNNLTSTSGIYLNNATVDQMITIGTEYCNYDLTELKDRFPNVAESYLATDCFEFVYTNRLLKYGYQIPSIERVKKINGNSIGWQQGVILSRVLGEPDEEEIEQSQIFGIVTGAVVFLIIIVLSTILIRRCTNKNKEEAQKRSKRPVYDND